MNSLTADRKRLNGLEPVYFQHPLDKAATENLARVKGLDLFTKKFMELGFEKIFLIQNIGSCLRLSETQVPSIYNIYKEACGVLEIPEPSLFIQNDPFPNAYTYGYTNPFIVVTTGLLKDFDEKELMFIMGHELGHVKCGHTLYNTMAENLGFIISLISDMTLGIGGLVTQGIQLALLEWSRKAEFSADRAGLLAVQDREAATRALSKLMAPTRELWKEINQEDIMKQAAEFEELSEDNLNKVYKFLTTLSLSHPWTILRTKEINTWINEGDYDKVLSMEPAALEEVALKTAKLAANKTLCPDCGEELTWIDEYQRWYCYACQKYP
ncbi:M48 family metallopeptidase [Candidatus Bathyarchaeota archaeon]|nr:M48 family metallopeptidase [Candidatus Bathyarchaeota archaeon]